MNRQLATNGHIEITETLVRLYVFLAQELDRCLSEAARQTFPEHEIQAHLSSTRAKMMEILSVNDVVKGKVVQASIRLLSFSTACILGRDGKMTTMETVKAERAVPKNKPMH